MLRRASTRGHRKKGGYKSPRRTSSPMGHAMGMSVSERRRSSVYTTSSGE